MKFMNLMKGFIFDRLNSTWSNIIITFCLSAVYEKTDDFKRTEKSKKLYFCDKNYRLDIIFIVLIKTGLANCNTIAG